MGENKGFYRMEMEDIAFHHHVGTDPSIFFFVILSLSKDLVLMEQHVSFFAESVRGRSFSTTCADVD
jgi:hypothetical protein